MKVILKQDVKGLGKKDEIVNASDGYAKNYLIPRGMAVVASTGNVNEAVNKQKAVAEKKQRELDTAKDFAAKLNGKTVKIKAKANNGAIAKTFPCESANNIDDTPAAKARL